MGLAERFKEKLNKQDIFKKPDIKQKLEEQEIQFISKPLNSEIVIQPSIIHNNMTGIDDIEEITEKAIKTSENIECTKFEDIETDIISKIRKTPYWEEYSSERKKTMIEKYFNAKLKTSKYATLAYSNEDKIKFIQNVLILSDNR